MGNTVILDTLPGRRPALSKGWFVLLLTLTILAGCQVNTDTSGEPWETDAQPQPEQVPLVVKEATAPSEPALPEAEAKAYQNLWQKIADAQTIAVPSHSEVTYFLGLNRNNGLFPINAPAAAEPWLYDIISELEARDMPLELALLPLIESGYHPGVKGLGGAGLWQLSAQTGRNHHLRVNQSFDGRLDPIPATRAALDYLLYLYEMFNNDWLSAVAAYNMGEGKLKTAIERNRRKGKAEDFLALGLSRNQAPTLYKWLAALAVLRDPQTQSASFPPIANAPVLAREAVPNGVALSNIAQAMGMSAKELSRLNPAFRDGIVPFSGKYQINLPESRLPALNAALVNLRPSTPGKGGSYQVKSGDTLSGIAKRHGMRLDKLLSLNGLNMKSIIKPGQQLRLE
ncbi:transglycosylase SLT domain-containing protein [Shewanella amazonensis]|uniref:Transglycosylase, Slt family n=1 Tax=Shewanella amazonensis (strain ATCC BAA-1098 / SB2B) TaxID=326297 RepID=A1S4T7_SHEAM|nr:transglycosylase SLT domain-containing protein [Shewanella amazonensis]ABL99393.1 transglycosylase, Slt family [Shewanella amazonensis SB2B]